MQDTKKFVPLQSAPFKNGHCGKRKKRLFFNSIDKLELLNPLTILKRGYSITYIDNKVINDINKVKINDILTIQLDNGKIIAKTTDIKGE